MHGQYIKKNVDILPARLLFTIIYNQLIKLQCN